MRKVFYIHTDIVKKTMGGKKRAKQFFQKHSNNAGKMLEKNRRKKVREMYFYIHANIVTKNGVKNARNNFSRNTQIVRSKNVRKKIVEKKCLSRFYIFTRIS